MKNKGKSMNIWYLVDEFPPNYGGGIGMYVDIVSRLLAEKQNKVVVITADTNRNRKEIIINDYLLHVRFTRPKPEEYSKLGYFHTLYMKYYSQTMKLIEEYGAPDIIEVTDYNAIGYYVIHAKRIGNEMLKNTKIVVHCHTPSFEINPINRTPSYQFPEYWIGRMEKYCLRAADMLVTQSQFLKDRLLQYTNGKDIEVIPLPYHFNNAKNQYACGEHLLYTGRLEYRKGIWDFLPHMIRCWKEGATTPLILLGGDVFFAPKNMTMGDMIRTKYKEWIEKGLLKLMDKVSPTELEELMVKAKAVVIPSLYENYPYTNVIAMSNHVPVLVSRQGGQAEAVQVSGKYGFIFDWSIKDDCYEMIKKVLATSNTELKRIGESGYQRIFECCNPVDNINKRIDFYKKTLDVNDDYTEYPFANQMEKTPIPEEIENTLEISGCISVVIPYYNLGNTVEETVVSILLSNYDNKEIILLDDGSTDKASIDKVRELVDKYPQIKYVRIENGGLANARNIGAQLAKGEYLCFVDADDTIHSTYFSRCIEILKNYKNVSFVYSWLQYFGALDNVWPTFDTEFPYFCAQNQLAAMCVVRRKDFLAFGHNHREMEYGLEDYDGWLGMAENGYFGVCIPETLTYYRIRENSMARSMNTQAIKYLRTTLISKHEKIYRMYGHELYALLLQNGSNLRWGDPLMNVMVTDAASVSNVSASTGITLEEHEAIKNELNLIKQRRGYRLIDRCSKIVYRFGLARFVRFRALPALKQYICERKSKKG